MILLALSKTGFVRFLSLDIFSLFVERHHRMCFGTEKFTRVGSDHFDRTTLTGHFDNALKMYRVCSFDVVK